MKSFIVLLGLLFTVSLAQADSPVPLVTVDRARDVLADLDKLRLKGIPTKLIEDAQAVAIIPNMYKAGFVIGGRIGHGLVLTKDAKGFWSEPTFVTIRGASIGLQAGVQASDVVLVFKKVETLEKVLSGKGKLTLGADASIAAGPVGREATAATDGRLSAEIFSYSRSRGLFAGVSLDGAGLTNDREINDSFKNDKRPEMLDSVNDLRTKLINIAKEPTPKP
jgi:lipid-binding SYLF domain-containing protein